MNAVAVAAGVTRLTVYNQFGSRRGLLEAVFDDRAAQGGIKALVEAAEARDPVAGLEQMIETLCKFWGSNPVIAALEDAAGGDPELRAALESRQARRRLVIDALLARMGGAEASRAEASDLLYGVISLQMFRTLLPGRGAADVARLMSRLSKSVLAAQGMVAGRRRDASGASP